jgi:hypothetical protein
MVVRRFHDGSGPSREAPPFSEPCLTFTCARGREGQGIVSELTLAAKGGWLCGTQDELLQSPAY